MTIISDYATLKSEVASWSHRTDLTTTIPGLIDIAECEIFRELALRNVETSVSGTTSGDTLTFPDDAESVERIKLEYAGTSATLDYTSPNGLSALLGSLGRPSRYTVENGAIRLLAAPDGPYSYTIYYVPKLASLSDAAPSNWLLLNHADLYLKACLLQVAKYNKNPDDIVRLTQEVAAALDSVKRADERKRFPIAGGLQIKPRSYR